jgi:hypothetical protein
VRWHRPVDGPAFEHDGAAPHPTWDGY